jgi:hypothetical protein
MKLAVLITLLIPVTRGVPFQECLEEVRSGKWGATGGFDNYGNPASNISTATAISYDLCKRACGTAPQPFKWPVFGPQFSAWLLPSLALVSGLPFGANNFSANWISVFLAVGSPALAAYSLALTVLNRRWVASRFKPHGYPNEHSAVQFLNSLQQSPLRVTAGPLLENHVTSPGEYCDRWWNQLAVQLERTHTWSLAAATSITWVLVAYILTVVSSFQTDLHTTRDSHGQAIGSVWLWLLAIIVCWLLFSPKYDPIQLQKNVVLRGGILAYALLTPNGDLLPVLGPPSSYAIVFWLPSGRNRMSHDVDQWCTAPIYNYARFLPWMKDIEGICSRYDTAPTRTRCSNIPWRYLVASLLALILQWGTTGAAVVINWYTPTTGKTIGIPKYLMILKALFRAWVSFRSIPDIRGSGHTRLDNACPLELPIALFSFTE